MAETIMETATDFGMESFRPGDPVGEIGLIAEENLSAFRNLLLPQVYAAIENGEPVTALGWAVNGRACGALAGFMDGCFFEIASFFVNPEWRGMGGGSYLLETLTDILDGFADYYRIEFSSTEQEHEELEGFLRRRSFVLQPAKHGLMYETSLGAADSAMMGDMKAASAHIRSFDEVGERSLKKEEKRAFIESDPLPMNGFSNGSVDPEVSVVYETEGEITGYIAIEKKGEALFVSAALNRSGKPQVFLLLLREALELSTQKYGKEYSLLIPVTDNTADGIVRKLFPGAKQTMRVMERAV